MSSEAFFQKAATLLRPEVFQNFIQFVASEGPRRGYPIQKETDLIAMPDHEVQGLFTGWLNRQLGVVDQTHTFVPRASVARQDRPNAAGALRQRAVTMAKAEMPPGSLGNVYTNSLRDLAAKGRRAQEEDRMVVEKARGSMGIQEALSSDAVSDVDKAKLVTGTLLGTLSNAAKCDEMGRRRQADIIRGHHIG